MTQTTSTSWLIAQLKENNYLPIEAEYLLKVAEEFNRKEIIEAACFDPLDKETPFEREVGENYFKEKYAKETDTQTT